MGFTAVAKTAASARLRTGVYLLPLAVGIVAGGGAGFMAGMSPVFKGQSSAILLPLLGLAVSVPLWLACRKHSHIAALQGAALCALLGVWLVATGQTVKQHTGFNYLIGIIPVLIVMVLIKPPRSREVILAARVLGLSIVVVALAAELFSLATGTLVIVDPEFEYTTLGEITGLTKRWVGPFIQENYAGPIASYVFIFALTQRGWYRWTVGILAAWMVLASTSSTAVLGVVVGMLTLGVFISTGPLTRFSRTLRATVAIVGFTFAGLVVALRDLTFNGRTTVWSSYVDVWQGNPWGGVGTAGVESALRSGQIPLYWTHAHNVPLDLLTRHGVMGLSLILTVYVLSTWGGLRAAMISASWPLAIVLMFIVMGLMEVPGDWLTLNIPVLWLILAILASQIPLGSHPLGRGITGSLRSADTIERGSS
jgi:hypothetical protein